MGITTARRQRLSTGPWLFILTGLAVLAFVPLLLVATGGDGAPALPPSIPVAGRIAYLEYGSNADTVWLTAASAPDQRQRLLTIKHAPDFGAVGSLAPDNGLLAYTALAPNMKPAPDAPADLWLASLSSDAKAVQVASGVDVLVRPVWSPAGDVLVFRRSTGVASFSLVAYDVASMAEHVVVEAATALFPVAFAPDARSLYYVEVGGESSELLSVRLEGGEPEHLGRLADGLTRDWALSPAGDRLAYLEMSFATDGSIASRAFVFDIATRQRHDAGDPATDAFGPVWGARGGLTLGSTSGGLRDEAGQVVTPSPARGFDVPVAWSGQSLVVRSFDGASAMAPGRATLQVIGPDGGRTTISDREVTFLGWIDP